MRKIGQIFRFLIPVIALGVLVVFLTGAGRRKRAEGDIRAKTIRVAEELWNKRNTALVDEIYRPDFVRYMPAPVGKVEGREAFRQYLAQTFGDYPERLQVTIDDIIVEGDRRTLAYTFQGTHKSGVQLTFKGCSVARYVDGKMVEEREYWDMLEVLQQFGFKLVPPGGGGGK